LLFVCLRFVSFGCVGVFLSVCELTCGFSVSVCVFVFVHLCFVCAFVRRWAITGTLDPVRNLTGLTVLYLNQNSIGGMFVRTVDGIAAVLFVLACLDTVCVTCFC
jgi:hypothetical protein